MLKRLLFGLVLLLLPASAIAQDGLYVALYGGATKSYTYYHTLFLGSPSKGVGSWAAWNAGAGIKFGKPSVRIVGPFRAGVEAEVFASSSEFKGVRLGFTFCEAAGIPFICDTQSATTLRSVSFAPNLILSLPSGLVEPYFGGGPIVQLAELRLAGIAQKDIGFGAQALAGMRMRLTNRIALLGEYQLVWAMNSFRRQGGYPGAPLTTGLNFNTWTSSVNWGVVYHF